MGRESSNVRALEDPAVKEFEDLLDDDGPGTDATVELRISAARKDRSIASEA